MNRGTLHRASRELCRAALAAVLALPVLAVAAGGATGPAMVAVAGRAPALPPARELGRVDAHSRLSLTVVLAPRDPAALAAFASAVSTPGSPSYRHYLSVHQFDARFGSSAASIAAVRATFANDGLSVGRPATDGLSVPVSGSAAAVSRAFHVSLHRFRGRSGLRFYANIGEPRVPARLRGIVSDVLGLNDLPAATPEGLLTVRGKSPPSVARAAASSPFAGGLGPAPCAAASDFAAATEGEHTIDQIAQAYSIDGLYADDDFGKGITIALYEVEGYPSEATDIPAYESCFGLTPQITPAVTYVQSGGGPGAYTPTAETAVDIQNIIGLAPMAKIIVYQGPNDYPGTYDTLMQIVDAKPAAQVINDSWGECETAAGKMPSDENTLLEQAAAQGQTFVTSSGDRGSEGCVPPDCDTGADSPCATWSPANPGPLEVDDPASQPYATGVGASDLTTPGPPPSETVWSQLDWGASGGGLSTLWAMPKYQANSGAPGVINSYTSGTPCGQDTGDDCREVPDVSADGAPQQGYVIFWNGVWWAAGGTSTGAPVWSALIALADASPYTGCQGTSLGFVNPLLYEVGAGVGHATAFNDITSGDNNPGAAGPYPAGPGYDLASGFGTPIATDGSSPGLVQQLCDAASIGIGPAPTITSISAPAVAGGASHEAVVGSTVKIMGSNFTPFSAVWFGSTYATTVSYVNSGELDATVPAGSGSVYVTVEKQSGESVDSALDAFTFPPTETISSPASGAVYTQGQPLTASYSCAASTPGTPTCKGSVPAGSTIDTSTPGQYAFSVSATDANGFTTTTGSAYTVVPPPSIAIAGPAPGATYSQGQVVAARFSCSTATGVTIASCEAPVMNGAPIDTQTLGSHSFTVSATDSNGVSSSQTATYQVVAAAQAVITSPVNGQSFVRGAAIKPAFACAVASPARIVSCTATSTTGGGKLNTSTIGTHTFTATATSSSGVSARSSVSYTVVAVRPRISDVRQSVAQWIERRARHGGVHVGTTFSFTLDQAAKVTLSFTRATRGAISSSGRCVAPSRAAPGARRCTLARAAGALSVRGQRAANSFAFSGKTSSGTLGPGRYTVTLTARGLSGKPSAAVSLQFTIVST
jgi:Pro-kumamolisin, activation domain/IPT/TIG domain